MEKPSTRPRHKVARKMKWSWFEWQLWAESMRNENDPRIACILSFYFAFYLMAKTIRRKAGEERGEKMWNTKNRETWSFLLRVSGCTKVGRDCNSICDRSGWSEAASTSIVGDITAQSNLILLFCVSRHPKAENICCRVSHSMPKLQSRAWKSYINTKKKTLWTANNRSGYKIKKLFVFCCLSRLFDGVFWGFFADDSWRRVWAMCCA